MPKFSEQEARVASASEEDYLLTVYRLQSSAVPVSTTAIAERLSVAPASVTSMIQKLHRLGLLEREPYRGVTLTAEGEREALRLLRRHRLWELFLTEVLELPWDEVHEEAHRLEHATSERVTDRLARYLGEPETDPHGHQIPDRDGMLSPRTVAALIGAEIGHPVRVVEVPDNDQDLLRYLGARGLYPGAVLRIVGVAPIDGALMIEVGRTNHSLNREVAAKLLVSLSDEGREASHEKD